MLGRKLCEGSSQRVKGADRKSEICEEGQGGTTEGGQRGGTMEREMHTEMVGSRVAAGSLESRAVIGSTQRELAMLPLQHRDHRSPSHALVAGGLRNLAYFHLPDTRAEYAVTALKK